MNSREIKSTQLDKSAFGYKADSVDSFVNSVYTYAKELEDKNAVLEKKIAVLAKKIEEYRADESNMKEALVGAQRLGQTVINEANEKANVAVAQANLKAEKILKDAEEEAEKKSKELKLQIVAEEKALLKMKKEVSEFKSKLLTIYKSHLDVITALPELEQPEQEETAAFENDAAESAEIKNDDNPQPAEQNNNDADKAENDEAAKEQKQADEGEKPVFNADKKSDKADAKAKKDPSSDEFTAKFGELKFGRNSK